MAKVPPYSQVKIDRGLIHPDVRLESAGKEELARRDAELENLRIEIAEVEAHRATTPTKSDPERGMSGSLYARCVNFTSFQILPKTAGIRHIGSE